MLKFKPKELSRIREFDLTKRERERKKTKDNLISFGGKITM